MAIRDIINNYYYGKQGQADMTVADLPATRLELFFTVLKVRFTSLVGVNLLYLLAWIPAILWTLMNLSALYSMQAGSEATGFITLYLLGLFPCIAITGPFNAGVSFVLRNWARDQHSFVLSDFWDAVKGNWKQAIVVSTVSGLLPFLSYVAIHYYSGHVSEMPVFILPIAVVTLIGGMWSMATMVMYVMLDTYALRLRDVIRNALLLTIVKLPFAVLFKLLTLIFPALAACLWMLIPDGRNIILMVLMLMYLLILPAFNKLITASYANWLCETTLNPRIEGAQTNIGLRPENWDDTEYRPEDDEE